MQGERKAGEVTLPGPGPNRRSPPILMFRHPLEET